MGSSILSHPSPSVDISGQEAGPLIKTELQRQCYLVYILYLRLDFKVKV